VVVIALERVEGNAYVFYRCKLTNEIEDKGQYCLGERKTILSPSLVARG
jgi:hypothetical protein